MSVIDEAYRRALDTGGRPPALEQSGDDRWFRRRDALAFLAILAATAALFLTAPVQGEYWWSARLTVALFTLLAGWAAYGLGRTWLSPGVALGGALLFLGLPETARWGRQVTLELPQCALLLASLWAFVRHLRSGAAPSLYVAAALFAATLYTGQTALFLAPVLLLLFVRQRGRDGLRDRHAWIAAGCLALVLAPLAWMTLELGSTNVQSVVGGEDTAVARTSLANWTWYLARLPGQAGWLVVALAAAWSLLAAIGKSWRLPADGQLLLTGWFVSGYLFFSAVSLEEPRFTLVILFPLVLAVATLVQRAAPRRWAGVCMVLLAVVVFGQTLATRPVPYIAGYAEAAEWIAARMPERGRG